MLKIVIGVGCMKTNSSNTSRSKGDKFKVTRSNQNCAKNIKYIPKTSSDRGNIIVLYEIAVAGSNDRVRFLTGSSNEHANF